MFWADRIVHEIEKRFEKEIAAKTPLIIRDEKTASGRVHIGSMRGVAVHGVIAELLAEKNIAHTFLYEINDLDPMDDIPVYLDQEKYKPYLYYPLYRVPSPDESAPNYAEYFGREFKEVIEQAGFYPQLYRTSELYTSGRMNPYIRLSLERRDAIRRIDREISGSEKKDDWYPLSIIAPVCGEGSRPKITGSQGDNLSYVCEPSGETGTLSPFDGTTKLTWKVDWAAKFAAVGVHIEGGGKDHSTKGGARDVANHIAREVFNYEPPFDIPYEFFLIEGKKMSSSKGRGSSAKEIAQLVPPPILRLALLSKDPKRQINFAPEGDTVPVLYDLYDKLAGKYWSGVEDDDTRLFRLIHPMMRKEATVYIPDFRDHLPKRFLPRFSQVAFLVQMPHMNLEEEVATMKGAALIEEDRRELEERVHYAKFWLSTYAPEDFKYELKEKEIPDVARSLSQVQKEALKKVLVYLEAHEKLDGQELHSTLHAIRKEIGIEPQEFFGALYLALLGKESGPKAGWFLSVLDRDFLLSRLKAVSA